MCSPSTPLPKLTAYHVDNIPGDPSLSHTDLATTLAFGFAQYGEVHEVRPYVWAGTSLITPSWLLLVAKSKDTVVPAVISPWVEGARPAIVERTGRRNVCQYCLSVEHTKPDCRK